MYSRSSKNTEDNLINYSSFTKLLNSWQCQILDSVFFCHHMKYFLFPVKTKEIKSQEESTTSISNSMWRHKPCYLSHMHFYVGKINIVMHMWTNVCCMFIVHEKNHIFKFQKNQKQKSKYFKRNQHFHKNKCNEFSKWRGGGSYYFNSTFHFENLISFSC